MNNLLPSPRVLTVTSPAIPQVAGAAALVPLKLSGHEAVNTLFEYTLILQSPDALQFAANDASNFPLHDMVGREITCTIELEGHGSFVAGQAGNSGAANRGAGVRQISRALGLPWWDKPAQPCLASRFPYGEPITAERLQRVAAAEAWLLAQGWSAVRVRSQGQTARIELPADQLAAAMARWAEQGPRQELVEAFLALGFSAVGLDLEGLVSGKLNRELKGSASPAGFRG
jgi:hypothetical protein